MSYRSRPRRRSPSPSRNGSRNNWRRRRRGKQWQRGLFWAIAWISLSLMLGGCVDLEAGIEFWDANHGAITQTIRLDGSLAALTDASEEGWFDALTERSQQLGGKITQREPGTLTVKIPFHNGADLSEKFTQLLTASTRYSPLAEKTAPLAAQFSLEQQNFIVAVKNHLEYDLDLRSLQGWNLDTADEGIQISILPRQGFNATFGVTGPKQLTILSGDGGTHREDQWQWPLHSGELNHIAVDFWVPSYVGWGALCILGLVGVGWWIHPQRQGFHGVSDASQTTSKD